MPAPEVRGWMRVRARRSLLQAAGLTLCCSSLLWSACSKETPTPQKPLAGPGMPRQRPTTPTSILPPVGSSPETSGSTDSYPPSASPRFEAPPERPLDQPAAQQASPAKARDYSGELSMLMKQSAPTCLVGWDPSGRSSIDIRVTAQVMGSGAISRAEVQAAGVTPSIVTCIQKQAGALQLPGPIEGAPRSVSAWMSLQTQGSGNPQPRAAVDTPQDERDENPRDSKLQEVTNEPPEVMQKDEPAREAPEPAEPRELPPADDTRPDEQP